MNLKFKNTFLFVFGFIFSCQNPDIMEKSKFKEVLTKLHQCEAYHEMKFNNLDTVFVESCKADVFFSTQVDQILFNKTLKYYQAHPLKLEEIYDSLILETEKQVVQ